ncbi:rhamnogalacturonan acetylesterase [Halalkalibacter urbisdiaboli]|uniref:rhamnogalacturonan acetylesterase n=1 Tax=Halalkalibacter urbisdiaboli TaxID=1960589 RepID=UPI000B436C28|nr:rhamnogalacturonan acetylesterase [Halalkalibacter urbisdiaboli]
MKRGITLFLAGDSTVANYIPSAAPMAGWGQFLGDFFKETVTIKNKAINGRSSKSFIEEGVLDELSEEIGEGDYLFIQFGHNDAKEDERRTEPYSTYQQHLSQYIKVARSKGAIPILFSSVERRKFNNAGELEETHGDYPKAMEELAKKENVPFVDLRMKTRALYESLGAEKSKELFVWFKPNEHPNYQEGIQDDTHFHEKGAAIIAKLVVEGLKELHLPLTEYVKSEE